VQISQTTKELITFDVYASLAYPCTAFNHSNAQQQITMAFWGKNKQHCGQTTAVPHYRIQIKLQYKLSS